MTSGGLQMLTFAGLTAGSGLLMALSGLQKKLLHRKHESERCRTCGRTDRWNCACRR